jgi:ABC-type antimicrobial peptide transport system permease subunit
MTPFIITALTAAAVIAYPLIGAFTDGVMACIARKQKSDYGIPQTCAVVLLWPIVWAAAVVMVVSALTQKWLDKKEGEK